MTFDPSIIGESREAELLHQIGLLEVRLDAALLAVEVAAEKLREAREVLTLEYRARRLAEDRLLEVEEERDEMKAQLRRLQ